MTERNLTKNTDDTFSALIGFIADQVIVTDSSGQIVASNHIVEQYTGIIAKELIKSQTPKMLLDDSLIIMSVPKNVKVKNKLGQTPSMRVDPDKMKRVFMHLIKNGVDAMPDGGKITVESKEVKGGLEISFVDTGIGISDEVLPKLFSPLFTTNSQGMGFGLAICKPITEAHRGAISDNPVKCQGTTFTITLPVYLNNENGGENVWINIPESSLSTTTKQSAQQ